MSNYTPSDKNVGLYEAIQFGNYNETNRRNASLIVDADCDRFIFILYVVAMGITCVLGLLGNTVSYLILRKDRSTPVASFLLRSLGVADNSFLFLWMIHYCVRHLLKYMNFLENSDTAWIYFRVGTFPMLYMAQTLTIWLTVVIAINRYVAVCLPYRASHICTLDHVYKSVAICVVLSIVYNIPRYFELRVYDIVDRNNSVSTIWDRTVLGRSATYKLIYTDALYYLVSFVLPLLILFILNARIIFTYHMTQVRRRNMSTKRTDHEASVTMVMIMVVVVFMVCQAPARIVQLAWGYKYRSCTEFQYYLIHISNTLEVLNSSANFLVYCTFHRSFREAVAKSFLCRYCLATVTRITEAASGDVITLDQVPPFKNWVRRTASKQVGPASNLLENEHNGLVRYNAEVDVPVEKSIQVHAEYN